MEGPRVDIKVERLDALGIVFKTSRKVRLRVFNCVMEGVFEVLPASRQPKNQRVEQRMKRRTRVNTSA
jgi:hypothetical protein